MGIPQVFFMGRKTKRYRAKSKSIKAKSNCIKDGGKIDLIITKSVSRFARNTVDSLTTIRKLKEHKVECYFEKKDFYTGKVPKNAMNKTIFWILWCLVGVYIYVTKGSDNIIRHTCQHCLS